MQRGWTGVECMTNGSNVQRNICVSEVVFDGKEHFVNRFQSINVMPQRSTLNNFIKVNRIVANFNNCVEHAMMMGKTSGLFPQ